MANETRIPDVIKSLTWIFEDPNWVRPYVIGAILGIIPIVQLMPMGYSLLVMKDALEGQPPRLRDWEGMWGETFLLGLKALCLMLLYAIPALVIVLFLTLSHAGIAAAAMMLLVLILVSLVSPLAVGRMLLEDSFAAGLALTEILGDLQRAPGTYFATLAISLGISFAFVVLTAIPVLGWILLLAGNFAFSLWIFVLWGTVAGPLLHPPAPETPAPNQPF